ncbi:hypothetical protein [Alteribacter natronophilus]|uniref:hypothetical protein n=1 Tax=Alteribacter natronophilus TaxID=2583810 RepID=UPI00110EB46F|nr:hypothetical protein [Alteribacter natronophilus]TMW70338.1 hypothetical protein FGB90_16825 [Alteribacter natronophilus]
MMSLNEISTGDVIKKQIIYKMRTYKGAFTTLMFVQLLGILFSLGGTGSFSMGGIYTVAGTQYSSMTVIIFTGIWAFVTAVLLTTKEDRKHDFVFVTNRLTSNVSNAVFLGIISVISGITAILSGFLLAVILILINSEIILHLGGGMYGVSTAAAGIFSTSLYILMAAALGYLAGSAVQLHPVMKVVIPAAFFGFLFSGWVVEAGPLFAMVFLEESIWLFLVKMLGLAALCFGLSAWMTDRLEVM